MTAAPPVRVLGRHSTRSFRHRPAQKQLLRETAAAAVFLLPSVSVFVVFFLIPALVGLGLCLFSWNLIGSPEFVGLENFRNMVDNPEALHSIVFTIGFVLVSVPIGVAVGLMLALLVESLPWGKLFLRSIFFAPSVSSLIAMSLVWSALYSTDTGLFNYLLSKVGIGPVPWLTNPVMAPISIIILTIWSGSGFTMLIFIAGLRSIDRELYEAASIDGANGLALFRHITWPLLSPSIFFVVITSTISGLQVFDQVYLLTGGGPGYATTTLVYFIVQAAFTQYDVGLAAAMSLTLFVFIGIVTAIQWHAQRRWVHYS